MSSTQTTQSTSQPPATGSEGHLNGAAIIDALGREIPITEAMIASALKDLEQESFQRAFSGHTRYVLA